MKNFIFLAFLIFTRNLFAATADTVTIQSRVLGAASKAVVILPYSYQKSDLNRYPVVYLLHGYSGNYSNWLTKAPDVKQYADQYQLIIVCPDGKNSWYIDSKNITGSNYESYVAGELIPFIDASYRTHTERSQRAICGLSMGGHGALYLAIRHQDVFCAAGSMSGVLDLIPWKNSYGITQIIGDSTVDTIARYSDLYLAGQIKAGLSLIIDCGISDPFIGANRRMHEKLMALKIPHDYIERDGGHSWPYWRNALEYQMVFFHKRFYGD